MQTHVAVLMQPLFPHSFGLLRNINYCQSMENKYIVIDHLAHFICSGLAPRAEQATFINCTWNFSSTIRTKDARMAHFSFWLSLSGGLQSKCFLLDGNG